LSATRVDRAPRQQVLAAVDLGRLEASRRARVAHQAVDAAPSAGLALIPE
jgi:hypothetical protein